MALTAAQGQSIATARKARAERKRTKAQGRIDQLKSQYGGYKPGIDAF